MEKLAGANEPEERIPPYALATLAVAAALFSYHVFIFFNNLDDDALITTRYALNFVQGHGWVMNPGERVEGVTSPLHLWFLTASLRFFSIDQTIWIEKILGYLLGLGILWQTYLLGRKISSNNDWVALGGALLLGVRPDFALSMTNGLETGFAVVLSFAGLRYLLDDKLPLSAAFFSAAALTRPEVTPIFPLLLLIRPGGWKTSLRSLALFAVPLAIFLAWRWFYYGDLLPNTYYAKSMPLDNAFGIGLEYLMRHISLGQGSVAFLFMLLPWIGVVLVRKEAAEMFLYLCVPIAFVLVSSGSWMPDGRFVAIAMPVVALLSAMAIAGLAGYLKPAFLRYLIGAGTVFLVWPAIAQRDQEISWLHAMTPLDASVPDVPLIRWRCASADGRRVMGDWIRTHVPKGETVACSEMGVPPIMNMDVKFIDFRGLCDRTVARMRHDVKHSNVGVFLDGWMDYDNELLDYILERHPYAIVVFDGGTGCEKLKAAYRPTAILTMGEMDWTIRTWIRK